MKCKICNENFEEKIDHKKAWWALNWCTVESGILCENCHKAAEKLGAIGEGENGEINPGLGILPFKSDIFKLTKFGEDNREKIQAEMNDFIGGIPRYIFNALAKNEREILIEFHIDKEILPQILGDKKVRKLYDDYGIYYKKLVDQHKDIDKKWNEWKNTDDYKVWLNMRAKETWWSYYENEKALVK